jgi:sn-glycerol 3-phosphate transport system permease protein
MPSLFFLLLFTYWPILEAVRQSLFDRAAGDRAERFVGLGNYARLFADRAFLQALTNNLIYAFATIGPSLVLALALSLCVRRSSRFNSAVRALLFLPTLVPLVAAAALFSFIFMPRIGLLDHYLAKLAVPSVNWIGDPDLALASLSLLTVWKNAGYFMLFYLAGLQQIPPELDEAAILDGASAWRRLRHITLPLLGPTTAFVTVIALVQALTQVDHVVVLTKGGPSNSTNLLLFYIYQTAQESFDLGKAAAATALSVAALLALSLVSLKTLERGIRYES